jgi:hypothetical protein
MSSPVASGASIASGGLKAYGDVVGAKGKAAADRYRAATLMQTAERAKVQAVQTGATESEQLVATLGNIKAVRAAARGDPTSPMAAAYGDYQEELGNTKKAIDVDNIMAKARQDESDAAYLDTTAKQSLLMGDIAAGADIASSIASATGGPGGGDFLKKLMTG